MCGAPDRRSPLAALGQPPSDTTHVSVTKPRPPPCPPSGTNPVPLPPTTLCPDSLLPPSPFHPGPGLQDPSSVTPCQQHLPFRFPVHRLHWSCHSLSPLCPFRPSSVLQTSVDPGLLIPSAFYTPPALNYPPTPLYLTHTTPPTLTHWWFSTRGAQPRHPTDGFLPLTHQPINLHLVSQDVLYTSE